MSYLDFEINVVRIKDKNYPSFLRKLKDPPQKLYFRGNLSPLLFKKSIAIVGSRRMTKYGQDVIDRFVAGLVGEKVTTVSGFMYGVDTAVHAKTLEYGGKTVAVLGCGLNVIYPPENEKLYGEILAAGGVVFSEYEPTAKPHLWKFPQRNRIVAGLTSLGVLIIEAGAKSGSLITANIARSLGKKVFAVPGPITSSTSEGTNNLIRNADANIVLEIGDIFGKRVKFVKRKLPKNLSVFEQKIYAALVAEPLNLDEIAVTLGENVTKVSSSLSIMALKGIVTESGGKFYGAS